MNVAIIPARGGSKRIPRKNLKLFGGKPMLVHSIEAALKSGCFEKVVVSTDDPEIAVVARKWGADVPFDRPLELSDDHTPTRAVINHAIAEIAMLYGLPEFVCCIYATAPFLRYGDLIGSLITLRAQNVDFVFSVTTFASPIQRALRISASGAVVPFYPEFMGSRSQDLEEAYHDAGQFYWGRPSAFLSNASMFGGTGLPFVLPRWRVQDIDTIEDWQRAELMFDVLTREAAPGAIV
ncbi:pseudaminic acid cytidylyltransferase [Accumulibacter sp.]|uniref:pseudaminic acid cytidylyltransferase n=1 Tax=Accumulibacter sp. TaxID=2053492 RepID=UPI002623108D|nr:pseudaminic acid cytidylyltransferase [Accumulibacter sp.]